MSPDTRILNLTRNCLIERGQAKKRIAAGVMVWVSPGKIARECTLAEVLAYRAHLRDTTSGLPGAEIPGCKYEPPANDPTRYKLTNRYYGCLAQAREFYNAQCTI